MGDTSSFFVGLMKERTPEKSEALEQAIKQFGIHFEIDEDAERCLFTSQAQSGKITVGLKGVARLQGHCYAYVCAHYGLLVWLQTLLKGKVKRFEKATNTEAASQLLSWAIVGDVRSRVTSYEKEFTPEFLPQDLANLASTCLPEQQQLVAADIFANALTFILYHEVSHIQLGHSSCNNYESIEHEREADYKAGEWMLDSTNINPNDFIKRQWGIATALGWSTASTAFIGTSLRNTHPASYNRLYQTIDHIVPDDHDQVWLFVQVILILQILFAQLAFDEETIGPPMKQNASLLLDVIANVRRDR